MENSLSDITQNKNSLDNIFLHYLEIHNQASNFLRYRWHTEKLTNSDF